MRLRNIPRADEYIANHNRSIIEEKSKKCRNRWHEIFGNDHPLHIEIGMGKGQFILTLAKQNPEINYVGIEKYSSVLLRALEKYDADESCESVTNIRFICMDARAIGEVFGEEEVSRIYLNFSDPWPKSRHASRRLPSKEFLKRYDSVLKKDGVVEFKTDNRGLFDFGLEQVEEADWNLVECTFDLHHHETMNVGNVMTEYEAKFSAMGNPIHKMIINR